mmetsp:Transcript_30802/g.80668  ORF Transcript_30802/g.80668 Transcript_30802/m.80668 type:complete len:292 (-) Transcript_30802:1076-1951(-)
MSFCRSDDVDPAKSTMNMSRGQIRGIFYSNESPFSSQLKMRRKRQRNHRKQQQQRQQRTTSTSPKQISPNLRMVPHSHDTEPSPTSFSKKMDSRFQKKGDKMTETEKTMVTERSTALCFPPKSRWGAVEKKSTTPAQTGTLSRNANRRHDPPCNSVWSPFFQDSHPRDLVPFSYFSCSFQTDSITDTPQSTTDHHTTESAVSVFSTTREIPLVEKGEAILTQNSLHHCGNSETCSSHLLSPFGRNRLNSEKTRNACLSPSPPPRTELFPFLTPSQIYKAFRDRVMTQSQRC